MGNRYFKKVISLIVSALCTISIFSTVKAADVVGIDGGISNANAYQEYDFVDGTPNLFKGTAKTTSSLKNNIETVKIDYSLTGSSSKNTLKRTISYNRNIQTDTDYLDNIQYSETIVIGKTTYTLSKQGGYQLSKADTISNNAGINFLTGDWNAIKTYDVTGGATGTLTIQEQAREASNQNYWGEAHFQLIKEDYNFVPTQQSTTTTTTTTTTTSSTTTAVPAWSGHVEVKASSQRYGSLNYQTSLPVTTAYKGTYTRTDIPTSKVLVDYDMPDFSDSTNVKRKSGDLTISLKDNPIIRKYVAINLKDVNTNSGENSIQRVTSFGIMNTNSYFMPALNMTRGDFLKSLLKACNATVNNSQSQTNLIFKPKQQDLFVDIKAGNTYYDYVKSGIDYGIIQGNRGGFFKPNTAITKSELAVMITRALGLHDAPYIDGAEVTFKDENKIQAWAKEDLYTLAKIGIIKTDKKGNVYPNDKVTRRDAATILDSLLKYLQKDLQKDYDSLVRFQ